MQNQPEPKITSLATNEDVTDPDFRAHLIARDRATSIYRLLREGLENLPPEIETRELRKRLDDDFTSDRVLGDAVGLLQLIEYMEKHFPSLYADISRIKQVVREIGGAAFLTERTVIINGKHRPIIDTINPMCDKPLLLAAKKIVERIRLINETEEEPERLEIGPKKNTAEKLGDVLSDYIYPSQDEDARPGLELSQDETAVIFAMLNVAFLHRPHVWKFVKNHFRQIETENGKRIFQEFNTSTLRSKAGRIVPRNEFPDANSILDYYDITDNAMWNKLNKIYDTAATVF
jgi:hypothetical protein